MTTRADIRRYALVFAVAPLFAGCSLWRGDSSANEVEREAVSVESKAKESHTLSSLARMEESLAAYVKAEKRIPEKLDDLVPKYLAEIPTAETGLSAHGDTQRVRVYPSSTLRDGHVDGTRLKDTGGWGYVYNDRQVVVFVDCTHKASSGRAWYLERGSF